MVTQRRILPPEEEEEVQPDITPEVVLLEETTKETTQIVQDVVSPDILEVPPVPLEDTFFSADEAAAFGADIPIDWQLKETPEGVVSVIDPGGWEFLEGDLFISPEGTPLTLAQVEFLMELPEEERPEFPTLPQVFESVEAIPEVPVTDRIADIETQLAGEVPGAERGALEQQLAGLKAQEALGVSFPEQQISDIIEEFFLEVEDINLVPPAERARVEEQQALALKKGQEFIDKIVAAGRTPETEALLKTLDPSLTDEEITAFFTQPGDVFAEARIKNLDVVRIARVEDTEFDVLFATQGERSSVEDWVLKNIFPNKAKDDSLVQGATDEIIKLLTGVAPPPNLLETAQLSFVAGWGNVISTASGTAGWLGWEGIAENLSAIGADLQENRPPNELGEFDLLDLLNPEYYATKVAEVIPFALSLAPLAIGGFYAGSALAASVGLGTVWSWIIGGLTGAALSRPAESALEAGSQYDDAISRGKTPKEAREEANEVFRNNMLLVGADAWEIAIALAPTPKWVPAALIKRGLVRTAIIAGKTVIVGLSEGGEEVFQDMISRRARGEDWKLDPVSKEVFAIGMIMGMGMGLGGSVITNIVNTSKENMTTEQLDEFGKSVSGFQEDGFTTEQAELKALDVAAQTPEGAKVVGEAIETVKEMPAEEVTPIEEVTPAEEVEPLPQPLPPTKEAFEARLQAELIREGFLAPPTEIRAEVPEVTLPRIGTAARDIIDTHTIVRAKLVTEGFDATLVDEILRRVYRIDPNVSLPSGSAAFESLRTQFTDAQRVEDSIKDTARLIVADELNLPSHEVDMALEIGPLTSVGRQELVTEALSKAEQFHNTLKGEMPSAKTLREFRRAQPSAVKVVPLAPQARAETRAREKGISIAEASREIAEEAIAEVAPVTPVVEVTPLEERTQKELAIQKTKQDSFVETTETENLSKAGEDSLEAQSDSAGLPPPNIPPGQTGHIGAGGNNSENTLYDMVNSVIPGENAGRAALRLWDGTRNRMATETVRWWRGGNKTLKDLGVGKTEGRNQRLTKEDSLELFKALHGEGAVPANLQTVFDEIKTFLDQESSDMLAFDPTFSRVLMAHPDYFPRGWRPPREPRRLKLGARPGFLKPRVDATFTEMIDAGWEPISWNPYDMVALRRMSGTEYREGQILIRRLKTFSQAIAEHDAPREGWRVPKVGPAFEGKPYVGADGRAYMTPKVAVPTRVADILESIYGTPIEFRVGGVDIWRGISAFGAVTKRAKLFMSLFQHVDFLTRNLISAFTPEGIRHAEPLKFPALAAKVTWSAISPLSRANLETQILSGEPLYVDSDISLKMVADKGWKLGQDELLIRRDVREQLENIVTEAQAEGLKVRWFAKAGQAVVKATDPVTRRLAATARFFEAGLFDGVYRESQSYALEHVIIPRLRRLHPEWTTEQIAGSAAEEVNKQFSTLAVWQSVLQQPAAREFARTMFFSWNETESWVRQATSAVTGKNAVYWREYTIAIFVALAIAANVINMISEGEPLPPDKYVPFVLGSPYSSMPWGIAYNDKFLSPRLPWNGRNGQPIYLDIVGQADTWLRWLLDPFGALTARVNVLPRAVLNQAQGEDFWGRELKDWEDRVKQLILDLFTPIGAGNLLEIARLQWPDVGIIPESEGRIGIVGSIIQATGLNVRSIKTRDMLDKFAKESGFLKADGTPVETWSDLEPSQRRELEKNETLQRELGLRSAAGVERQYPGAEGFAELDELDQERITRGEALVAELIGDLLEVDRATAFDLARAFRNEVSRLKKEIADRKSQVDEDFQLFKDTGELPDDPNKRALVEYYNIFDKALRPSGVMDWDKVRELELALRDSWTPAQEAYVDRNIGLTEWGPLMQEFVDAQRVLSDSGYWDEPDIDRRVFRFERPEIEDILTGKFYNQKPIEEEAEKIGLKWQDTYRQIDAMKENFKSLSDAELNKLPPPEGISAEDWAKMNPDKKQDALIDAGKEDIYNENPGFWDDDKRKTAWNAIGDLLDETRSQVFVSEYVDYSNIVREFGANSSQAKLYRFDSKELNASGTNDDVFGWEDLRESELPIWRIDVEWEEWDDWYDAIEDTVVDGQEFTAAQIRAAGLELYPDYAVARRKRDAHREGVPENLIDLWVEYYSLPLGKARTDFLRSHPEYYTTVWLGIQKNKPI